MWKKGVGVKHEKCGGAKRAAAAAGEAGGDIREAGEAGGGRGGAELRCLVCGKPAGCPACEFSDSCDTAAVSQLCMCRSCLEDKDTYALYRAASSRRFPLLEPAGVRAAAGQGGARAAPPADARAQLPAGHWGGGKGSAAAAEKGGGKGGKSGGVGPAAAAEKGGGKGGKSGGVGPAAAAAEKGRGKGGVGPAAAEKGGGKGGRPGGGLLDSEQGGGQGARGKGEQAKLVPGQTGADEQDKKGRGGGSRSATSAKRGQTRLLLL